MQGTFAIMPNFDVQINVFTCVSAVGNPVLGIAIKVTKSSKL